MNESFILYNTSYFKECVGEMSSTLGEALVSLVRMDQTRPDRHQHNEATKYEVTVSLQQIINVNHQNIATLSSFQL